MRKLPALLFILAGLSVYLACQEKTTQPPPVVNCWNIHGQVLRIESNAPIVGARITFASDSTLTDTSGYYNFDSVPEGRYLFRAALSGFPIYHDSVSLTHDLEYNVPLIGFDNLYGLVTNRNGDTVQGAVVTIGDIKDTTDDSGYYYLRSVPVGQRILDCTDSEQYPFLDTLMITIFPQRHDIILEPKYNLIGTVKDRGGIPIQGAIVAVGEIQGASDSSGYYQLPLVPIGEKIQSSLHPDHYPFQDTINVTAAQSRRDIVMEPKFNVIGTVLNRSGSGVPNAIAAVGTILDTTDDSGFYQLPLVPLGQQVIHCRADKYAEDSAALVVTPAQQRRDFHLTGLLVDTFFVTEDASVYWSNQDSALADSNDNGPRIYASYLDRDHYPTWETFLTGGGHFLLKLPHIESNIVGSADSILLKLLDGDVWSDCSDPRWGFDVAVIAILSDWNEATVTYNDGPGGSPQYNIRIYPGDLRLDITSCYRDSLIWPYGISFIGPYDMYCMAGIANEISYCSSEAVDITKRPKVIVYRTY